MTGKIFINYRRLESLKDADHLHTQLLRHFRAKSLFIDRHGIEGGKDWLHELERQVASSDAMLALIGRDWVGIKNERGLRRIDNETDFVRFEIAEALRRNIPILPVLIDGAQMPRPEQLPPNLLLLTRPQAMLLRSESFKEDADRIAAALKDLLKQRRPRGVPYWAAGVVAMLMLAVGTLAGPYVLARMGRSPTGVDAASQVDWRVRLEDAQSRLAAAKAQVKRLEADRKEALARLQTTLQGQAKAVRERDDALALAKTDGEEAAKKGVELKRLAGALAAAEKARDEALAQAKTARADEEAARRVPRVGATFRDCLDVCPEMVVVPAGSFMMGSPAGEEGRDADEGPQRKVTIARPFAVGKFEVTFAEWDACVAAGGCKHRPGDQDWGRGRRPAINVSWDDAKEYVVWLSRKTGKTYRLLSEAEWEYAARAGTTTRYAFGDTISRSQTQCSVDKTVEVGSFPANKFGLHDMHGNVWEWVEDARHPNYQGAPEDGSVWPGGDTSLRVLRGGSWYNIPRILRSAVRLRRPPSDRFNDVGFRLASTL